MTRTVQPLFDLRGKTALVTDGARGLGLQMAHALGEAGARLMLTARSADDLELAVADLQSAGIDARWVAADVAQEADIHRLVDETLHRMGDVDILVNNVDSAWCAHAQSPAPATWEQVMNLGLRGYLMLSQRIAQQSMTERRQGRIINVVPVLAPGGNPPTLSPVMQQTAQGAVKHFTRALAAEWGPYHITVNAICLGGLPAHLAPNTAHENAVTVQAPLPQLADDALKGACLLFASDAGRHLTGQCLTVGSGTRTVPGA